MQTMKKSYVSRATAFYNLKMDNKALIDVDKALKLNPQLVRSN